MSGIPFLDLPKQHAALADELVTGFREAVSTAGFIGGRHVDAFESAFAAFCERPGCVGVGNGTDALMLALKALGIGPGDAVLVPSYTFIATAEAVTMLGATPILTDVDGATYTMTAEAAKAAATPAVKAIIPVHLYGQAADMDPLLALAKERGWKVLEDCAQAHGARNKGRVVGSMGDMAAFSFYPGKNLGALGDGGAVVGGDLELLDRVRRLSNHGRLTKYEHGEPGVNSRLDAIQALALGIKLTHLPDWNGARARVASWYDARLRDVAGLTIPQVGKDNTHVYHLYVLLAPERDRLLDTLGKRGIGCGVHYPLPLHLQPAYRGLGYGKGAFPVSEKVAEGCLSLPMYPELTEAQVDQVVAVIREHVEAGA